MSKQKAKQICAEANHKLKKAFQKNNDQNLIQQACSLFMEALESDPQSIEAYMGIAYLSFSAGKKQEAMGLLMKAREIDPINYRIGIMIQRVEKAMQTQFPDVKQGTLTRRKATLRQQDEAKRQALATKQKQETETPLKKPEPVSLKEQPRPQKQAPPPLPQELVSDLGLPQHPQVTSQGPEVLVLQQLLLELGYQLQKTGQFDKLTFAAIRRFQTERKLPITGWVDKQTRDIINPLLKQHREEEILQKELLDMIQTFRKKRGLPHSELWQMLNKDRMHQVFKSIQLPPTDEELAEAAPDPEPSLRPLLHSTLGTLGKANIISEGIEVLRLQETLKSAGYDVPVSGTFELQTHTAVTQFQKDCGLPVTGEGDHPTRKLLNEKLADRYEAEETIETIENRLRDFQAIFELPRTYRTEQSLYRLVREMLFSQTLKLTADLGPANRSGKISQGIEVAILQSFLNEEGYKVSSNQTFDQQTYQALANFQKDEDLTPTGTLDDTTRELINQRLSSEQSDALTRLKSDLGPPNRKNTLSRGAEVLLLQKLLNKLGYSVSLSEVFDTSTAKAISALQMRQKIPITGIVDRKTRKLLNRHLSQIGLEALDIIEEEPEPEETILAPPEPPPEAPLEPENPFEIVSDLGPSEHKGVISEGPQVLMLKQALLKLGQPLPLNEKYDKATYAAVRRFQMEKKIPMTGIVDKQTRQALNPILAIAREEDAFLEEMEAVVRQFRKSQNLPHTGVWETVLRYGMRKLLHVLQEKPGEKELENPASPPPPVERPLLQSLMGTQGQAGVVNDGIEVLRLQETLKAKGYHDVPLNSSFDLQTYTVMRQFQQDHNLSVTGEADLGTRNLLNQALEKRYQEEIAAEKLEQLGIDFQHKFALPRTTAIQQRMQAHIRVLLFDTQLEIHSDLGPANRAGKISKGVEVAILRDFLKNKGYALTSGEIYDQETTEAVREFQKENQLPPSGLLDPKSRELINQSLL